MPELPEVETTRRGIEPHCAGKRVTQVVVRDSRMRWPVTPGLEKLIGKNRITSVARRAKYLLLGIGEGTLIVHLGMSGSLRIVDKTAAPGKHDHVDIVLEGGKVLRYNDPRRFGCLLWHQEDPINHPLLSRLGPEPLGNEFDADYMYRQSRRRKAAVKAFLMDGHIVVGVGNIYANEALHRAGVHPSRQAGRISRRRYDRLVGEVRAVLMNAIADGGTTLRDFVGSDGKPGYFRQQLAVYGRGGEPCQTCATTLKEIRLGQRSTVFCPECQT